MPTTIFQFQVVEGQDWIAPVDSEQFERFFDLDGTAIVDWQPPLMRLVSQEADTPQYSDFPWLGEHAPVLRESAVEALGDTLRRYGQILPLRGERAWLLNVTRVLADAFDEEKSGIVRFDDGSILTVERYRFRPDAINGVEVFKLPFRCSPVFVNDVFVERVRRSNLKGVAFEPLWSG